MLRNLIMARPQNTGYNPRKQQTVFDLPVLFDLSLCLFHVACATHIQVYQLELQSADSKQPILQMGAKFLAGICLSFYQQVFLLYRLLVEGKRLMKVKCYGLQGHNEYCRAYFQLDTYFGVNWP